MLEYSQSLLFGSQTVRKVGMRGLIGDEASWAAAFDHRIENGERFTRMCRQRQLLGLAYLTEALTENENRLVFWLWS